MKKYLKILKIFLLAMIVFVPFKSQASEGITFNIPIEVTSKGESHKTDYTFTIESKEESPLPDETTISTSSDKKDLEFGPINVPIPGEYTYLVKQVKGDDKEVEYDDASYKVLVYVTNSEKEDGQFDVAIRAYKNNADEKSDIKFENNFKEKKKPAEKSKAPKTGVDSIVKYLLILLVALASYIILTKKKTNTEQN